MKKIYWFFIVAAAVTLLILLFSYINRDRMMDRMIEMAITRTSVHSEYLEDREGIRIFTLGTSSPLPDDFNQTGTAVFVEGKFFIFDLGDGVVKEAELQQLPLKNLDAVFISHWHSDHYMELPNALNRSWLLGRNMPLNVYGPKGLDTIMSSVNSFLRLENENRVAHHGSDVMNLKVAGSNNHEIDTRGRGSVILYSLNSLRITAFEVCHDPIKPAYGFRIDYKGKSVVISGDTRENCPNLLKFAQGADLLLHEVMLKDLCIKTGELNESNGDLRNAKIVGDIVDYHTDPIDVGKLASEAKVKKLVLHHFVPMPTNIILRRRYKQAIRKNYKGPLSLAKDGKEYYVN